jgi:frataxin-like iron-binding protein CyaY
VNTQIEDREICIADYNEFDTNRHQKHNNRRMTNIVLICAITALLCLCGYFVESSLVIGTNATKTSYTTTKDEVSSKIYQDFYDSSYKAAEAAHHVSNDVSISIGSLREEQKLEVLKVSEVTYEQSKDEDRTWIEEIIDNFSKDAKVLYEIPGVGVFTVNLKSGEIVIDNERQYVLIRIPSPELSEFTIDYENVELLYFEKEGAFSYEKSAKAGIDNAREHLQNAELTLRQKITSNQEFYKSARNSAVNIITKLVKQLNPQLENLIVEVEFID